MKKEYIRPEMIVEEVLLEGMLAASLSQGEDDREPLSNRLDHNRRGSWGNLWSEED